jgi:hypothetical protein
MDKGKKEKEIIYYAQNLINQEGAKIVIEF